MRREHSPALSLSSSLAARRAMARVRSEEVPSGAGTLATRPCSFSFLMLASVFYQLNRILKITGAGQACRPCWSCSQNCWKSWFLVLSLDLDKCSDYWHPTVPATSPCFLWRSHLKGLVRDTSWKVTFSGERAGSESRPQGRARPCQRLLSAPRWPTFRIVHYSERVMLI